MSTPSLLLLVCGNPSRGDDALGPALAQRLREQNSSLELIEDFQLQVEHALDMLGRDLVLFIDAGEDTPAPFAFRPLQALREVTYTTHVMPPEAVLHTYTQIRHAPPPPSFLLSIRGESFNLGEALSETAQRRLDAALAFTEKLLARPDAAAWKELARCKHAISSHLPDPPPQGGRK